MTFKEIPLIRFPWGRILLLYGGLERKDPVNEKGGKIKGKSDFTSTSLIGLSCHLRFQ
jgi:hypothetical protein